MSDRPGMHRTSRITFFLQAVTPMSLSLLSYPHVILIAGETFKLRGLSADTRSHETLAEGVASGPKRQHLWQSRKRACLWWQPGHLGRAPAHPTTITCLSSYALQRRATHGSDCIAPLNRAWRPHGQGAKRLHCCPRATSALAIKDGQPTREDRSRRIRRMPHASARLYDTQCFYARCR